ncbi:MAG: hypothetical protein VX246_03575, partial [Myxococcota bacterium]|nr:hypothetical protein [Myxococcota bacterium]
LVLAESRPHPEVESGPLVVASGVDGRAEYIAFKKDAAGFGIRPNQTVAHARAACARLVVRTASMALEHTARLSLLDAALSMSPRAELAERADPPFIAEAAVFLDAAGTKTLFESEAGFASALLARAESIGLQGVAGIASSRFAARGVTRRLAIDETRHRSFEIVEAAEEARYLAGLPIDLLAPSDALANRLTRFGIRQVRDLLRVPRQSLAARLGSEAHQLASRARGEFEESPLPEPRNLRIEEASSLEYPIAQLEPLLFVIRGMLARLAERLNLRALAAKHLELELLLEGGGHDARSVGLSAPTLDVRVWLRVVALEFEAHPPPAPIESITIATQGYAQRRDQLDLFRPRGPNPGNLDRALAELESLCGVHQIGAPRVAEVHRPDAWAIAPFDPNPQGRTAASSLADDEYIPPCQYARPRLAVHALRPPTPAQVRVDSGEPVAIRSAVTRGTIVHSSGPWRTTGRWWSEKHRYVLDHYDIQVSDGVVARLCFDWLERSWRVDALYD